MAQTDLTDILWEDIIIEDKPQETKKEEPKKGYKETVTDLTSNIVSYWADAIEEFGKWLVKWVTWAGIFVVDSIVNLADIWGEVVAGAADTVKATADWLTIATLEATWNKDLAKKYREQTKEGFLDQEGWLDKLNARMDRGTTKIQESVDEFVDSINYATALDDKMIGKAIQFTGEVIPYFVWGRWIVLPAKYVLAGKTGKEAAKIIKRAQSNKMAVKLAAKWNKTIAKVGTKLREAVKAGKDKVMWPVKPTVWPVAPTQNLVITDQAKLQLFENAMRRIGDMVKLEKAGQIKFINPKLTWAAKYNPANVQISEWVLKNYPKLKAAVERLLTGVDKVTWLPIKFAKTKTGMITIGTLAAWTAITPTPEAEKAEQEKAQAEAEAKEETTLDIESVEWKTEEVQDIKDQTTPLWDKGNIPLEWELDWNPVYFNPNKNLIFVDIEGEKTVLKKNIKNKNQANDQEQFMNDFLELLQG